MARNNNNIRCPVCNSRSAKVLFGLDCGNFDGSDLYRIIRVAACVQCGHIFNILTSVEAAQLAKYYDQEYAPINVHAVYKTGGMPGGDSPLAFERYSKLYNFIRPHIKKNQKILDVGCASGGFLRYLHGQGFRALYGIDPTAKFVENAGINKKYHISAGSAESIPFKNNSFDVVVIDNVIEHLAYPRNAFREAKRVLTDGGTLYVGAPDASKYKRAGFEFLWFLFKEHIQHFDVGHLGLLAAREGFEQLSSREFNMPMTSMGMLLPAFGAAFRLAGRIANPPITRNHLQLKEEMEDYTSISIAKSSKKKKMLADFIAVKKPIYVWGIASEFFYLYESLGLKKCNIIDLIDINPYKQKTLTVDGRRIRPPSILKKASSDSAVLICATIHTKEILGQLSGLGYPGEIIKL